MGTGRHIPMVRAAGGACTRNLTAPVPTRRQRNSERKSQTSQQRIFLAVRLVVAKSEAQGIGEKLPCSRTTRQQHSRRHRRSAPHPDWRTRRQNHGQIRPRNRPRYHRLNGFLLSEVPRAPHSDMTAVPIRAVRMWPCKVLLPRWLWCVALRG